MSGKDFTVKVILESADSDVGVLQWSGSTNQDTLDRAVSLAADDSLIGRGMRRLEVSIPVQDLMARRALQRAGFRREGCRRQVIANDQGEFLDALLYSRLASDQVYGLGGFSSVMDTVLPKHRVMGHVLFRNELDEILLVEPTYKDDWELPGGVTEPLETPREGAEREVLEELGIEVRLGDPVLVDWLPPCEGWSDALEFLYDGGTLSSTDKFVLPAGELTAYHWVPEDELAKVVTPQSHRRLTLLLHGDGPFFTKDGRKD